ncbi:hypothetical protein D3C75_1102290 [compost metagenome]
MPGQLAGSCARRNQQEQRQRPEGLQLIAADYLPALAFEKERRGQSCALPAGQQRFGQMQQCGQHQQSRNIHLTERVRYSSGQPALQCIGKERKDKLYDAEQPYGVGKTQIAHTKQHEHQTDGPNTGHRRT